MVAAPPLAIVRRRAELMGEARGLADSLVLVARERGAGMPLPGHDRGWGEIAARMRPCPEKRLVERLRAVAGIIRCDISGEGGPRLELTTTDLGRRVLAWDRAWFSLASGGSGGPPSPSHTARRASPPHFSPRGTFSDPVTEDGISPGRCGRDLESADHGATVLFLMGACALGALCFGLLHLASRLFG